MSDVPQAQPGQDPAPKKVKKQISDQQFVIRYAQSKSYGEVAEFFGISKATVASRANKLRKLGVKLKVFPRQVPKKVVNVGALNDLLD